MAWKATIMTTQRCNLGCPRCGQKTWRADKPWPDMVWRDCLQFLCTLWRLPDPPRWIIFTGGEPTLWTKLEIAVGTAVHAGYKTGVFTNGIGVDAKRLLYFDRVTISNYGASNAIDRLRLKQALGRRVKIYNSAQVDLPLKDGGPKSLPAQCVCPGWALQGDRVYPCSSIALRGGLDEGVPLSEPYWYKSKKLADPTSHPLCRQCTANAKLDGQRPPLVAESFLWESTKHRMIALPWRMIALRAWMRRRFRRRMTR